MKKVIIFLVIASVVGFVGSVFYQSYTQEKKTVFQGEIDAKYYGVSLKVPGRVDKIYVQKGQNVHRGDLIFTLVSPELDAKLSQALAAKKAAQAQKEQAYKGARKEQIKAAKNQYEKALSAAQLMEKTYKRIQKLYDEGVVSEQKRDEVYTKYLAAKYTADAAQEMYVMAKKGTRKEVKKAAQAQEEVYAAKVQEVEAYLQDTKAFSYYDGEVSQILIEEKELAPSGFPVVQIVDRNDSWARFAIREDYLPLFQKGKIFTVKIPALGKDKTFKFKVSYISVMGAFATWKKTQDGKNFDIRSFEVHLRPLEPIEDIRVGMSVLIEL